VILILEEKKKRREGFTIVGGYKGAPAADGREELITKNPKEKEWCEVYKRRIRKRRRYSVRTMLDLVERPN